MTATTTGHRRAAVCIGVDRVGGLDPLTAAASGAAAMAAWARAQGCTVAPHTDLEGPVHRREVLATIKALVDERIYDQLIVYFAGHGLLSAPGVEPTDWQAFSTTPARCRPRRTTAGTGT
ncbi:caspase family protein [Nocardia puris]|uniref:Caspase domain-containing protein n=1 Tax=Nocardia puris TaxID=208602 RepID=A0A366D8C2_9NOCA|nr:caspase family protein [Nocardia puris]RBO85538.1 hypothetical protein DFR74_11479 [Nocardia puris]